MGCSFTHGRATLGIRDLGASPHIYSYNAAINACEKGAQAE